MIKVLSPGILTTVQDLGRTFYQRFGVPQSGALDTTALRVANILVGNSEDAAGLEITANGPKLRFLADTIIAITGANLGATLDDKPIQEWQSFPVQRDSVLDFEGLMDGFRAYIAFSGGIDVPIVMGSRSTYLRGGFGGFEGRALMAGDTLKTFRPRTSTVPERNVLPDNIITEAIGHDHEIRVVLGPQEIAFSSDGISDFLSSEYSVSHDSDRTGYRLEGPSIEHAEEADIISDGTTLGSVQVPSDGQPIVLLADRGTTGGYTKIATVISPDISLLAQASPGDTIRFMVVSVSDSQKILEEHESLVEDVKRSIGLNRSGLFQLFVEGKSQSVVSDTGHPVTRRASAPTEDDIIETRTLATNDHINQFKFEIEVLHSE